MSRTASDATWTATIDHLDDAACHLQQAIALAPVSDLTQVLMAVWEAL